MKLPPQAVILPEVKKTDYLAGDVTYEARCEDWTSFVTTKEPQKFKYDTNGCTQASGINCVETQMNLLKNDFSVEALKWFTDNGYFDANGNFDFSWRYTGIKAGCDINGSSHVSFWDSVRHWGLLPRKHLTYSLAQSEKFNSQEAMCEDFWDEGAITPLMEDLAKGALQWINVEYEYTWYNLDKTCPAVLIEAELKHAPLHIGTPVCYDWNSEVLAPCQKYGAAHSTMIWDSKDDASVVIRDQYNPYDKTLSAGYMIPVIVKGVVTVKDPMLSPTLSVGVWKRFVEILRKIGLINS